MIFDHDGREVGRSQREHEQILPRAGWVEHDPAEIWQRTQEVVGQALAGAGLTAADLVGAGLTNQRETTVVWDVRTGRAVRDRAIVWQDTRTDKIAAELERAGHGDADPGAGRHPAVDLLRRRQAGLDAAQRRRRTRGRRGRATPCSGPWTAGCCGS